MCFVVGGFAVVAGLHHLHVVRDHRALQRLDAALDTIGHIDGVFARLFGDRQRHGRKLFATVFGVVAVPDITLGRHGAVLHIGHVFQEHRLALHHLDHQVGHFRSLRKVRPGFDGHALVATQQLAYWQPQVGRLQSHAQIVHRDARAVHALRVNLHQHRTARPANGDHIAGAGHALDVGFDAVRHALQIKGTHIGIFTVQGERHDRHIVNALGLDERFRQTQVARQPIGVFADRVVQLDQRLGARHAHLELHRHDGHAGARDRVHMLDARDFGQHLLGRNRHHLLDFAHRRTRERRDHVGHGHVDLRLFFAGRHHHGKHAQQKRHQRQQRRDLCALEGRCDAARNAHFWLVHGAALKVWW